MKKIKILLISIVIPLLCFSQNEQMQSIGSGITYLIVCPCKLFKYSENDVLFYFCKDGENNIEYMIKEVKYKDGFDKLISALDEVLYGDDNNSLFNDKKEIAINSYLNHNPNGKKINFMGSESIIVSEKNKQKLFFLDDSFISSYSIEVSGEDPALIKRAFNKLINSIMIKSEHFKKVF